MVERFDGVDGGELGWGGRFCFLELTFPSNTAQQEQKKHAEDSSLSSDFKQNRGPHLKYIQREV